MHTPQARLQIATKIHFFLLRELGEGIDIDKLLHSERYARDVLLVCDACSTPELPALAQQFRRAMPPVLRQAVAATASGWAPDSSGFAPSGATPMPAHAAPVARRSWFARLMSR
jgi:hypothetical protein